MKKVSPVQSRKVSITFNPAKGRLSIRPKTITLSSREREEILWRCKGANLEIRFEPDDTPFRAFRWRCSKGGGCLSGIPKSRRRGERCIRYTITLLDAPAENGASARKKNKGRTAAPQNGGAIVKEAYLLLK
jgi:hypothetical protein